MLEFRTRAAGIAGLVRQHWLITVLLAAGLILRIITWVAYQPALLYGDSFRYLANVGVYNPNRLNPIGYDLFVLAPTLTVGGLELVTALQHFAALIAAFALYALAVRLGAARWLGVIAAAPLLLDAYELQIEQMIMSDTWFQVLLVALLWVLLGRGAPRPHRAAFAGLLLGAAVLVRLIALPLVIPAACYLIIAGGAWRGWRSWRGWRTMLVRTGAFVATFAVVVGGYAMYFHAEVGRWGLAKSTGNVLYGRASVIADCAQLDLSPRLRRACPEEPLAQRKGVDYYAHSGAREEWRDRFPPGTDYTQLQEEFGMTVIKAQPLDFARVVLVDFLKGFRPIRTDSPGDVSVTRWHFQPTYQYYNHKEDSVETSLHYSGEKPSEIEPLAWALRWYQLFGGYTSGTLLGLAALLALLAGFGVGKRARSSGMRASILLPVGLAITVLGGSAAFEFSWRYQLPGLVLLPLAGVLAVAAWRTPKPDDAPAGAVVAATGASAAGSGAAGNGAGSNGAGSNDAEGNIGTGTGAGAPERGTSG